MFQEIKGTKKQKECVVLSEQFPFAPLLWEQTKIAVAEKAHR